jgi:hypothetical protein
MNDILNSNDLWLIHFNNLKRDVDRISFLLEDDFMATVEGLGGKFKQKLSPLLQEFENLEEKADSGVDKAILWSDLDSLAHKCQAVIETQLEFLGGVAIHKGITASGNGFDAGFATRAQKWLNSIRDSIGLNLPLSVIVGQGPLLEIDMGLVRVSFLDWDLWHLPLLGRSLGFLAAKEQRKDMIDSLIAPVQKLFQTVPAEPPPDLELFLPDVMQIWRGYRYATTDSEKEKFRQNHQNRLKEIATWQETYLKHLFADMFATAILGPVYALAVFVLELDYRNPEQYGLENPDLIEDRETAPRFLPTSVQRAAAILATLKAMDQDKKRPSYERSPYQSIIQELESLWQSALQSTNQIDTLTSTYQSFKGWHQSFYQEGIQGLIGMHLGNTEEIWKQGQFWYKALRGKGQKPTSPVTITEITTAIWLHQLDYPDRANKVCSLAEQLLQDTQALKVPLKGTQSDSVASTVAQIRFARLERRWERLVTVLKQEQVPESDRRAVAGKFYRLISE